MFIPLPYKHRPIHQSHTPCTLSFYSSGVQELSTTRICSIFESIRWGHIEGDNEHDPTCVWDIHQSIGVEPIYGQCNTYITSLYDLLRANGIKVGPCFTIGCMYHLVRIVSFPFCAMSSVLRIPRSCIVGDLFSNASN
jgi:hypothetical protein